MSSTVETMAPGEAVVAQIRRRAAAVRLGAQGAVQAPVQGLGRFGRQGPDRLRQAVHFQKGQFKVLAAAAARLDQALGHVALVGDEVAKVLKARHCPADAP